MAKRKLDAGPRSLLQQQDLPDHATLESLWLLFVQIGKFWQNCEHPQGMKSNWLVFVENRIRVDPSYLDEYTNAAAVLADLIKELGEEGGYRKLFTDVEANVSPPKTPLARARQRVSNEFIALQLALGGFKAFGHAQNYLGYIGGANIKGRIPYRPYKGEAK